jgi:hypothetical protein
MPPLRDRPVKCQICGAIFKTRQGRNSHMTQKQDHIGLEIPRSRSPSLRPIPSYADPQFDSTNAAFHGPEWDVPLTTFGGESDDGDGNVEQEVDEGQQDQVFEGAGSPLLINHADSIGEPNENGPRIPYPRELARAEFQAQRGEFKDGKYENRWYPYNCRQQFRMARRNVFPRIPSRKSITDNCCVPILDRLAPMECAHRFRSHTEFMNNLDLIARRITPWSEGTLVSKITGRPYILRHRNSLAVLQELVGDITIGPQMKWAPVRRVDSDGNRVFTEMYTADFWWDQQELLHPDEEIPEGGSKTIIPLILSSDKTVYGALSGDAYGWPLYLSIGNIPSEDRWKPTRPHWRVIALIKDPKGH